MPDGKYLKLFTKHINLFNSLSNHMNGSYYQFCHFQSEESMRWRSSCFKIIELVWFLVHVFNHSFASNDLLKRLLNSKLKTKKAEWIILLIYQTVCCTQEILSAITHQLFESVECPDSCYFLRIKKKFIIITSLIRCRLKIAWQSF